MQVQFISLSVAGRRLNGRSPEYVKGCCDTYGVPLMRIGSSWAMSVEDFERLAAAHPQLHRIKAPKARKRSRMAV